MRFVRHWIYLLAVILILAAAAAVIIADKATKDHADKPTANVTSAKKPASQDRACRIFTQGDAKRLIEDAVKSNQTPIYQSSADLEVSTCAYTEEASSSAATSGRTTAALLVRYPKTAKGAQSNRNEFGPLRPAAAQTVAGYADQAYWDPAHGQLNILKNNIWYVLSYGQAAPADRSLDQAKQLADLLASKL